MEFLQKIPLQNFFFMLYYNTFLWNWFRGVAQFGRALRSGRRGRGFKSRHLDQRGAPRAIRLYFIRGGFLFRSTSKKIFPVQRHKAAALTRVTPNIK